MRSLNQGGRGIRLSTKRLVDQLPKTKVFARRFTSRFQVTRYGGTFGRERFPAIQISARAWHWRFGPNYHVSEFAGCPTLTTIYLPIKDYSRAHAFGDKHEDEISGVAYFRPAKPKLCKCDGIRIIVDDHGQANCRGDCLSDGNVTPLEIRNIHSMTG